MKDTPITPFLPLTKAFSPTWVNGHSFRALWLVIAAVALHSTLAAEMPIAFLNLGMEEGSGTPAAWTQGPAVVGVQYLWDQKTAHGGKASLCLKKTAQRYFPVAQWSQSLPVEPTASARKLRVRCWVKAQAVTKAIFDVPYEDAGGKSGHIWAVFLGQKQGKDPVLTHDWKLYEGVVEVPANSSKIGVAFQIYGPGSVWFDDLQATWVP